MAQDADDATSALIAKLLAQDYAAQRQSYSAYSMDYDLDDEDDGYEQPRGSRKKSKKSKGRKRKTPPKAAAGKTTQSQGPGSKRVKADTPAAKGAAKQRKTPRRWTEDEERLFLEALELHGRDWAKCVEHMGHTRNKSSFTSHAQKHFIKLYREDKVLPAKVRESGEGYTLSGKPLDPNSAAARAYGASGKQGKAVYRAENALRKRGAHEVIKSMLAAKILVPGQAAVHLVYKGATFNVDLRPDGTFFYGGASYTCPSQLSIHIKQSVTPDRKADNGWRSLKFGIHTFEALRTQLAQVEAGTADAASDAGVSGAARKNDVAAGAAAAASASAVPQPPTSSSTMSARERNDMLLREARQRGEVLRQKVGDGGDGPTIELTDEQKEAIERKKRERREAAEAKKKALAEKRAKQEERRRQRDEKRRAKEEEKRRKREAAAAEYGNDGRTEYSRRRTRRKATLKFQDASSGGLEFVPCRVYPGEPGSGEPNAQPFSVSMSLEATVLVDVHSHMTKSEVIGYLAGSWDPVKRHIAIKAAFPGKSVAHDDAHQNAFVEAEMDPVSEVELRSSIEQQGMRVVGWYHSHPTFEPVPSQVDIINQANQQLLFFDRENHMHPFVGMICSPYDLRMPRPVSRLFYYFVESPSTERIPMRVKVRYGGLASPSCAFASDRKATGSSLGLENLLDSVEQFIESYESFSGLVEFASTWRANLSHVDATALSVEHRLRKVLLDDADDAENEGKQASNGSAAAAVPVAAAAAGAAAAAASTTALIAAAAAATTEGASAGASSSGAFAASAADAARSPMESSVKSFVVAIRQKLQRLG